MSGRPLRWSDYERGRMSPRQGSVGSASSRQHNEAHATDTDPEALYPTRNDAHGGASARAVARRRSSISMRINSLAQYGGVNSIENFARSWQRAVGFHDIAPNVGSFAFTNEGDEPDVTVESAAELPQTFEHRKRPPTHGRHESHQSLLSAQIQHADGSPHPTTPERPGREHERASTPEREQQPLLGPTLSRLGSGSPARSIFSNLGAPFSSSCGATGPYGAQSPRLNDANREEAARRFSEQMHTGLQPPDKEREPLLLRRVDDGEGHVAIEVVGQSTIYQTMLNSTNVLVGVGILSLPLGLRYAGWLVGLLCLTGAAAVNVYTARLLGRCMARDRGLITFSDLAFLAFGPWGQAVISTLFIFELGVACVALFVLFADSLDLLLPGWGVTEWKVLCGVVMFPLSFVPLRLLGYSSSLGIVSCFTIVVCVVAAGLTRQHAPGSLFDPAPTYLFPQSWSTLPLSFGLLMAPWGGITVLPNIYRDMRHPSKFPKSVNITFSFTYILYAAIGIVGLLMFGDVTRDEITSNIFLTPGYPPAISVIISICIAVIPITKIPLNARPIYSTIEHFFGLSARAIPSVPATAGASAWARGLAKAGIRLVATMIIMLVAVVCPSFDRIMALMGSVFCYGICIVLPVGFYLRLYGKQVSRRERVLDWGLIVVASVLAVVGTVWAFLPKSLTGA